MRTRHVSTRLPTFCALAGAAISSPSIARSSPTSRRRSRPSSRSTTAATPSCSRASRAAEKWGRYSFLGVAPRAAFQQPRATIVSRGPPGARPQPRRRRSARRGRASLLSRYRPVPVPGLPRFSGGLVGYLGYDMVRFFERLPATPRDDLGLPDLYLMLVGHAPRLRQHHAEDQGRRARAHRRRTPIARGLRRRPARAFDETHRRACAGRSHVPAQPAPATIRPRCASNFTPG